jgi:hypothetical protein
MEGVATSEFCERVTTIDNENQRPPSSGAIKKPRPLPCRFCWMNPSYDRRQLCSSCLKSIADMCAPPPSENDRLTVLYGMKKYLRKR